MSEEYQLDGTERKEVTTEKIPCGDHIHTSYFDATTGKLVREDVEIKVSEEALAQMMIKAKVNFPSAVVPGV